VLLDLKNPLLRVTAGKIVPIISLPLFYRTTSMVVILVGKTQMLFKMAVAKNG
jgi:hypothetical protein